jgi:hypothetical protein
VHAQLARTPRSTDENASLTFAFASLQALHAALMACIRRGGSCPSTMGHKQVDVRAGMCIAVLFGREEEDDEEEECEGANTVPAAVTAGIVKSMQAIVDGQSNGSPTTLAEVLGCLSLSDANTEAMVYPDTSGGGGIGVLDVFAMMFRQGPDVVNSWSNTASHYNVALAREKCAEVLLDLALSAKTASAVANHAQLLAAVDHALHDGENLTKTAKKVLDKLVFHVRTKAAGPSGSGGAAAPHNDRKKHVMLSYAWAQQAIVLRIRAALGMLGYAVWIDVEKMAGSTVDAMATAIDAAQVVVYGVSEDYKLSRNCRLEAMYAHQQGVQMVPLMLVDPSKYRANGWLGMLLGVRLWYGFYGQVLTDDALFESRIAELSR